ncbi:DMT family transporter [Granulosicoccus sp.]|nr:DMT family transporter [Granulosicoccus sp.]MDB4224121.1 DMT family transporter [Granulosicoccus sp.]
MQGAVFYLLTVLIWGSTWFAIRFQLGSVDPSLSLVYRFGLAACLLLVWCVIRRVELRFSAKEHLAMASQGLCLFSVNYLLFYWCTGLITSGLVAIIFSTVIVMNIINGAIFLKKPVQGIVLFGALVGLLGITLVFWHEIEASQAVSEQASATVLKGLGIGLVATLFASLGNILSARNQAHKLPVLQTNAFGMAYGAIFMVVYALVSGVPIVFEWTVGYVGSLLYLSIFGSIIAFGAYLTLVGRIGADRAAYATVLFPLVALVISSIYENFQWTPLALVGVALVLIGNVIVVGRGLGARWRQRSAVA